MLDSGEGANMMSLRVMEKLGLKATRPYRNVCGFESRAIPTHGVVENVEVRLGKYPKRVIHMDIVVVDVPDVWGMFFSQEVCCNVGRTIRDGCNLHQCAYEEWDNRTPSKYANGQGPCTRN